MEDRRDHRVLVGVAVLVTLGVLAPAVASPSEDDMFDWDPTVTAETNADAVVVDAEVQGSIAGGVQASGSSGSGCWLEATNMGASLSEEFWDRGADELPYIIWCDGEIVGIVWRGIADGGASVAAADPGDIAMSLRDRIPMPNVTIKVNPGRGLVGVESWFWIEGYDGSPIVETTNAFGSLVEVEARVDRYEWAFGDDQGLATRTLGSPYPKPSEVHHLYERSSLGQAEGYKVEVGFFFSVRYRVAGGGWIDLPGIDRVAETLYPVRESQAVVQR